MIFHKFLEGCVFKIEKQTTILLENPDRYQLANSHV